MQRHNPPTVGDPQPAHQIDPSTTDPSAPQRERLPRRIVVASVLALTMGLAGGTAWAVAARPGGDLRDLNRRPRWGPSPPCGIAPDRTQSSVLVRQISAVAADRTTIVTSLSTSDRSVPPLRMYDLTCCRCVRQLLRSLETVLWPKREL